VRSRQAILFFSPAGRSVPDFVTTWVNGKGLPVVTVQQPAAVAERVLRALPTLVIVDADSAGAEGLDLCARLKSDPYTAIVPFAAVTHRHATDVVRRWFAAGADEVITPLFEPGEQVGRLDALVTRAMWP
jgi:DNA-binding response OmpR family regulator